MSELRAYSVMQSDGNSFGGDVVLNSFNKASWDEENILDQVYDCITPYVSVKNDCILCIASICIGKE